MHYTLIDREGRDLAASTDEVLAGAWPRFISCAELSGIRVQLPAPSECACLRLVFAGVAESDTWNSWVRAPQLPPAGALAVFDASTGEALACEEQRHPAVCGAAALGADATALVLRFSPRTVQSLVVRFPPGSHALLRLEVPVAGADEEAAAPPLPCARELPSYPRAQPQLPKSGDPLAEQLYDLMRSEGTSEPTLAQLRELALPYRGGALLGVCEGPLAYHLWDGGLLMPARTAGFDRLWCKLDLGPLSAGPAVVEQRLRNGFLPIAELRSEAAGATLSQTAFVDMLGVLRARWRVRNAGAAPLSLSPRWAAAHGRWQLAENNRSARIPVAEETACTLSGSRITVAGYQGTVVAPAEPVSIAPGDEAVWELHLPLTTAPADTHFEGPLAALEEECSAFLKEGATLQLPDAELQSLWQGLLLHNRLFQRQGTLRYGLLPGVYDGAIFGVEEGWNIVAMAMYGHPRAASELLRNTFFDPEFLKKEGQHHQYRNGLAITYARDVYMLTRERALLDAVWPSLADSADWIAAALRSTQVEDNGQRPVYYGLMPKHTYGGDLRDPTYSLYGSAACWRGLRDAALLAAERGDERAAAWQAAAAEARANMHTVAERIYRGDAQPPFLPFRIDDPGPAPSAQDYHQLFASLILETALFGWQGRFARGIVDYLQQTGRLSAGVARFDQWFGRLGVDPEYSRGVQLMALHRRDFAGFYLGLLGQIGLGCDPCTLVCPETTIVRFSASEYQERMHTLAQPTRCDSDPCSAPTAVMLQYLRYLLLFEERDEDDLPTGTLWLGAAAPPSWFAPGQGFGAQALATAAGPLSFRCDATDTTVRYELRPPAPLSVELFYCDAHGKRRSQRRLIDGDCAIDLPR